MTHATVMSPVDVFAILGTPRSRLHFCLGIGKSRFMLSRKSINA